ncbi:hypothetical protein ACLOJK_014137 [Asimina triloba]
MEEDMQMEDFQGTSSCIGGGETAMAEGAPGGEGTEMAEGALEEEGDNGEEDGEGSVTEGEDDPEDDEYALHSEVGRDLLDYAEDDSFGEKLYQHIERRDYEALAERKRKAASDARCPFASYTERRDYEALAEMKRKAASDARWQHSSTFDGSAKKLREDDSCDASIYDLIEMMIPGYRKKSRKRSKRRGRPRGSRNRLSPEITRKLGDATLHYASGRYKEYIIFSTLLSQLAFISLWETAAISVLNEVVRIAPNLADPYYTLGLVHNANGDKKRAFNFYMIAAYLMPKDPSLWKLLVAWSIDTANNDLIMYCLSKAITADPKDVGLRFDRASLYNELGHYEKAAESYDQILALCPANVEARRMAAKMLKWMLEKIRNECDRFLGILCSSLIQDDKKRAGTGEGDQWTAVDNLGMYLKCGQVDKAACILDDYVKCHPTEADNARSSHSSNKFPLYLTVKEGICMAHLGNMETAEVLFMDLQMEKSDNGDLIIEVADAYVNLGQYESALKYYLMLDGTTGLENAEKGAYLGGTTEHIVIKGGTRTTDSTQQACGESKHTLKEVEKRVESFIGYALLVIVGLNIPSLDVYLEKKIAKCYIALKERTEAIAVLYNVLLAIEDDIDSRLTLASLLLEEEREDEAITLLSPPKNHGKKRGSGRQKKNGYGSWGKRIICSVLLWALLEIDRNGAIGSIQLIPRSYLDCHEKARAADLMDKKMQN